MNSYFDDLDIEEWVKPFYFSFLHAPPLQRSVTSAGVTDNAQWLELLRVRVEEVSPEIVSLLLRDMNWRTRICGAWFCGLKRWDDFLPLIAHLLVKNQLIWQAQGFAFALARFGSSASSLALRSYMERVILPTDSFPYEDVKAALGALFYLDERLGRDDASDYAELWRAHLAQIHREGNIRLARELSREWYYSRKVSTSDSESADDLQREIDRLCEGPLPNFVVNCVENAQQDFQQLIKNVEELGF